MSLKPDIEAQRARVKRLEAELEVAKLGIEILVSKLKTEKRLLGLLVQDEEVRHLAPGYLP
jgi:hypothetical protein